MLPNILFVIGETGLPLDYSLSKLSQLGHLYCFVIQGLSTKKTVMIEHHSLETMWLENYHLPIFTEEDLAKEIYRFAHSKGIDMILPRGEFLLLPVNIAANRLGLPNAGANVCNSRNKRLMRQVFLDKKVPSTRFHIVNTRIDLEEACDTLQFPFLLKVTEGAGSFAQSILTNRNQASQVFKGLVELVKNNATKGQFKFVRSFQNPEFIAEELICSSIESWYKQDSCYADYVSVEGIVAHSIYYPIAITSRLPTVDPFTEVGLQVPCVLEKSLQDKIFETARVAVEALELENCATHTEIKLMKNQETCLVESAARLPGAMITQLIESVFEIDMIGLLVDVLTTGDTLNIPRRPFQLDDARCAAGALAILALDERGVPWKSRPRFSKKISFKDLLPQEMEYRVDWSTDLKEGEIVPPYDPQIGLMNFLGGIFMKCGDPRLLVQSQMKVRQSTEILMNRCGECCDN